MRSGYRVRGWFWQSTRDIRRQLRGWKAGLARARYRLFRAQEPARVHFRERQARADGAIAMGANDESLIAVAHAAGSRAEAERFVDRQTETALVLWSIGESLPLGATHLFHLGATTEGAPPDLLEVLLMVEQTFECSLTTAIDERGGYLEGLEPESHHLWRLEGMDERAGSPLPPEGALGMAVPFLEPLPVESSGTGEDPQRPERGTLLPEAGSAILSPWSSPRGAIHPVSIAPMDRKLAALAPFDRPSSAPSVLFLMPHLAIGGAERLLFHLLDQWRTEEPAKPCPRSIVVTTEPHSRELGSTIGDCRARTPHVMTLGDWVPREALVDSVRHLLRRYCCDALVSWNGTTLFFDHLPELCQDFPELRVSSQQFNHEGAWMERYGSALIKNIDVHLAVHSGIAREIEQRWQAPTATVEHAVPFADPTDEARRWARRQELSLPPDAFVVGGFFRLHEQKRPLDFLEIARRFDGSNVWFLLVGGGPLDAAVDAALDEKQGGRPVENLIRMPLVQDTGPLFEALDLCLMTSAFEGLPVFVLEGLARALPFVATPVGDLPDLATSGAGWVGDAVGDLESLESAVRRLSSPAGRGELLEAGQLGRALVRDRFSLGRFAERYRAAIFGGGQGIEA